MHRGNVRKVNVVWSFVIPNSSLSFILDIPSVCLALFAMRRGADARARCRMGPAVSCMLFSYLL